MVNLSKIVSGPFGMPPHIRIQMPPKTYKGGGATEPTWGATRRAKRAHNTQRVKTHPTGEKTRPETTKFGDMFTAKKKAYADAYINDLADVAQEIPEATFSKDDNSPTALKKWTKILFKLLKREDKYVERGYQEVIRDEIRARMFLPDADKNYQKVIKAMEKKGYKIAPIKAEDNAGNLIFDAKGHPIEIQDIDVRFGDKAQASGYEDVQIRFTKSNMLFELIILPGPNYLQVANREHDIYDILQKYDASGITKDIGAKQIVKALKKEFGKVTRKLYNDAEQRDKFGSSQIKEPVTFTPEGIKTLNGLFVSLRKLFLGKYNSLPPSKRSADTFNATKTSRDLRSIEAQLRTFMELFKPKENS